jgi:hypothetical protein
MGSPRFSQEQGARFRSPGSGGAGAVAPCSLLRPAALDCLRRLAAGGCLWAFAAPGCKSGVDVPEPPVVVQPIVDEYESPSGTLQSTFVTEVVAEALRRQELVDASGVATLVAEALTRLNERFEQSDLPTSTERTLPELPELDGFVRVDRICGGWDPANQTPDAALNGTLSLTATLEDGRLEPVVWGPARACRGRVPVGNDPPREVNGFVDGDAWVYLNEGLPRNVTEADFVLGFDGTLGGERVQADVSFDLRFVFPQVEIRVPVSDGSVIASVGLAGIGVRAANGTFACTAEPADCQRL